MSKIDVHKIRNVAVVAHAKGGKTTLVEAMLFKSGAISRMGTVEDGTTTTDFEPEETGRQMTISSALAYCDWKGHRVNLIDTPGFVNFLEDTKGAMKAADGALVLISAVEGVKGETEKVWGYAREYGIPCLVAINKLDREGAEFYPVLDVISSTFRTSAFALNVPIGEGEDFSGIVDLLNMKAYTFKDGNATEIPVPEDLVEQTNECRNKLVEIVAESNDEMLERYLEGEKLSDEEIRKALMDGAISGLFVPVVCCAPNKGIGIDLVLDAIGSCLPSPIEIAQLNPIMASGVKDGAEMELKVDAAEPFAAYVFKTVADPFAGKLSLFRVYTGTVKADSNVLNATNDAKERIGQVFYMQGKKHESVQSIGPGEIGVVAKLKNTNTGDTLCDEGRPVVFKKVQFAEPMISYAILPKTKGDEDKVGTGLHRILDEDSSLRFHRDEEAQEMILSGMGQVHLEITLEKLKRKFGVEVEMQSPKIPYRETIKVKASAQGKYKKQSGGKGQFGDCWIEIEPLPRGTGYEFENAIVGGSIPKSYVPAVDKGIQEAMKSGIFAGFPMVDVKVKVYDGSYHAVDSSEMAFKIAGSFAIKKAVESAKPIVLEPVMKVEITMPDEYLGDVIGDLNSRRGKVSGMDPIEGTSKQKISAAVPLAEMLTYANQLQSITSGRGVYHMEFSHYDELPSAIAQKLIEENKKAEE